MFHSAYVFVLDAKPIILITFFLSKKQKYDVSINNKYGARKKNTKQQNSTEKIEEEKKKLNKYTHNTIHSIINLKIKITMNFQSAKHSFTIVSFVIS